MSKRNRFRHDNRVRLIFTLGLAVLLPAAALIYVNFRHLESIKRDKKVEALIHRDFQYVLAVSEKKLNQKAYAMTEEVRDLFPSPDSDSESDKLKKLDLLLSKTPWLAHVFLFDHDKGMLFRSQPQQLNDTYCRKEHEILAESYSGWFGMEGKMLVEGLHKKSRPFSWYTSQTKRADGDAYITTAFFVLPQVSRDRVVLGGASFDPNYLKQTFFPEMLDELITQKLTEDKGERLAMMVYPAEQEGGNEVLRAGTPIELSAKEFALLAYFISHPAETLSRDRLLDEVWGYENYPNTRTVDTHIVHLRQKLELNPEEPRLILTVHGSGYKFVG